MACAAQARSERHATTAMSIMGTRVVRVEDPAFLTRGARYTDDLDLVGALHLTLVRSPLAHARIEAIDVGEARSAPGVVAVCTGADVDLEPALLFGGANEAMVRRVPGEGRGAVRRRAGRRRPHRGGLPGAGRRRPGRGRLRPAAGRHRPQGRRHRRGAALPRGGHQHRPTASTTTRTSTRPLRRLRGRRHRGSSSTSGSPRPRWRPAPPPREWGDDGRVTLWCSTQNAQATRDEVAGLARHRRRAAARDHPRRRRRVRREDRRRPGVRAGRVAREAGRPARCAGARPARRT